MPADRTNKSISTTETIWEQVRDAAHKQGISQSAVVNKALEQMFSMKIKRTSWETQDQDSWYDPQSFYTFSEDRKGHSAQLRIWVPKNLAGQISRIVNSGEIPELRSPQDFYRDAMFHRAHQVAQWIDDGELKKEVGISILQAEEDAIRQAHQDSIALIESTRQNLKAAFDRGDYEWMKGHIQSRLEMSGSIPELYRGDYERVLHEYLEEVNKILNEKREAQKRMLKSVEGGRRRRRVSGE